MAAMAIATGTMMTIITIRVLGITDTMAPAAITVLMVDMVGMEGTVGIAGTAVATATGIIVATGKSKKSLKIL